MCISQCPAPDFVGCTAVDLSDPQDECTTVGEPCPGSADVPIYCCRDACPRNYCTAKEAQPDASFAKASSATTINSGETTFAFSFATAILGLVVISFNFQRRLGALCLYRTCDGFVSFIDCCLWDVPYVQIGIGRCIMVSSLEYLLFEDMNNISKVQFINSKLQQHSLYS